jgi:uncharacterized protein
MLAPEIATRADNVAGVVMLAPPARAPWDIVLSQMRFLGAPPKTLAAIERTVMRIKLGEGDGTTLLGIPFAYWRDWADHDGRDVARTFDRPILLLHGDRDYQVVDEDLALWTNALRGVATATVRSLRGLNHGLMRDSGPVGPMQYRRLVHVDANVISMLARFVTATAP